MNMAVCRNKHIYAVIKHVEDNLYYDLDTKLLSRLGFVSHTQLYRDFYSITGHSVKEYIRKRRLSNALALVKTSDFPLADIACKCGYSSQQALCRAVREAVHMTPVEYKNCDEYFFFPPFNGNTENQITISTEMISQTLCLKFYHSSLMRIENNAVDCLLSIAPQFKGRIFGRNGKQDGTLFCYELYLTDADNILEVLKSSGFIISHEKLPFTAAFASTTVRNIEDTINAAWNYLYNDWLPLSMYECTNEQYFEEYLLKKGKPVKLRLYLPIQKRSDYTKITLENLQPMRFLVSKARGYNAEQISSETVIDYLSRHYPYIIKSSKNFYIKKDIDACTCSVKVNSEIRVAENSGVANLCSAEGLYAVLQSHVAGDCSHYRDMLLSWACDNGLVPDTEKIFTVYDAEDSYENPKIKLYCPVKLVQNGNASGVKPVRMKAPNNKGVQ